MTDPGIEVLPVGHRARRAAATALWVSITGAAAFTAFGYVTTQVKTVRAVSPWQDDPYDMVVSFTEFLVPALAVLMVVRASLTRRGEPQPVFRVLQLLRAALVCSSLVAFTVVADWLAVILRADHSLWGRGTGWLVATLVPLSVITAAAFVSQQRAVHRLPARDRCMPDGDWLDDLSTLLERLTALVPRAPFAGHETLIRLDWNRITGFVRDHIVAFAAAAAFAGGLSLTTTEAVGEGWTNPLLILLGIMIVTGGFFAFSVICNVVLRIAVRPSDGGGGGEATGGVRRAAQVAIVVGSLGLPASVGLRDAIWKALGRGAQIGSIGQLTVIALGGALFLAGLAFAVSLVVSGRAGRRPV